MDDRISVKLISAEDILAANCINIEEIIAVIEKVLLQYKSGNILLPDKISQTFDEESQSRINCMPSAIYTLGTDGICGVKWVSVFPQNPLLHNRPNVSGVIVLSEMKYGLPLAVMDGTLITTLRTACMGAIGAKYLARRNSNAYCAIGAGEQGKMHFAAIKTLFPQIDTCYVASRTAKSETDFCMEMGEKYPTVRFIACASNYQRAAENADIIVTAVSSQLPLLKADAIKKGAFYCHVGGIEDEDEVSLKADKIVCDNWNSLKHRSTPTLSRLYAEGRIKDEDIYCDIADIIDGTKPGRENDMEFNYFNSIGLSFVDVAVAFSFYKKIVEKGMGIDWIIRDSSIWECIKRVM